MRVLCFTKQSDGAFGVDNTNPRVRAVRTYLPAYCFYDLKAEAKRRNVSISGLLRQMVEAGQYPDTPGPAPRPVVD